MSFINRPFCAAIFKGSVGFFSGVTLILFFKNSRKIRDFFGICSRMNPNSGNLEFFGILPSRFFVRKKTKSPVFANRDPKKSHPKTISGIKQMPGQKFVFEERQKQDYVLCSFEDVFGGWAEAWRCWQVSQAVKLVKPFKLFKVGLVEQWGFNRWKKNGLNHSSPPSALGRERGKIRYQLTHSQIFDNSAFYSKVNPDLNLKLPHKVRE